MSVKDKVKSNVGNFESKSDKGVSPVIGVILMVAITVILSAVIGVFVLDLAGSNEQPAQASVTFDEDPDDGLTVQFTENVNAEKLSVRLDGTEKATLNTVGDSTTLDVPSGSNVSVFGINNGQETVLQTYKATEELGNVSPPNNPDAVSIAQPTSDSEFTASTTQNVFRTDIDVKDNDSDDDLQKIELTVNESDGTTVATNVITLFGTDRYVSRPEQISPDDGSYSIKSGETYTLKLKALDSDGNYDSTTVQDTA